MSVHSTEESDAQRPLLGEQRHTPPEEAPHKRFSDAERRFFLFVICAIIFLLDTGEMISYAPRLEILESIICQSIPHERSPTGGDKFCQSAEVQGQLAMIIAWKECFDMLPSIVLAMPYGYLSDRLGRKPVLILAFAGIVLEGIAFRAVCWWHSSVPIRAIWLTPLLQIIGGGTVVTSSMILAMVVDIYDATSRANIFFIVTGIEFAAEVTAGPMSALLMLRTPWLPLIIGSACQIIGLLSATTLRETHLVKKSQTVAADHQTFSVSALLASLKQNCRAILRSGFLSTSVLCVLASFLLSSFGKAAQTLFIQYASKRFTWSYGAAGLIITYLATLKLVLSWFILPWLSSHLATRVSPMKKDLMIVQGSAWILVAGAATIAVAATPSFFFAGIFIMAMGWGFGAALRSLAIGLLPSSVGTLTTLIGLAGSIGSLLAVPALAASFRAALGLHEIWLGLPYMIAATIFVIAAALTYGISIHESSVDLQVSDGDDESDGA